MNQPPFKFYYSYGMIVKVYFKDTLVKVTSLRITCHHITVSIDKIDAVKGDFKIRTMTAAFTAFALFLILVSAGAFFHKTTF